MYEVRGADASGKNSLSIEIILLTLRLVKLVPILRTIVALTGKTSGAIDRWNRIAAVSRA